MRMSSRTSFLLPAALLLLVVGTATARYYEVSSYSDDACEDLSFRVIVDGIVGQVGLETFGECTNLTSLTGQPYSSGMYECADSVVTLSYYANDTCDGDVLYSNTTSTNCTDMQRTSCTEESDWTIANDWIVNAVFYDDDNCTEASGVTGEYNVSEVLGLSGNEACAESNSSNTSNTTSSTSSTSSTLSSSSSGFSALRCVDDNLAQVMYSESDTTCSSDFTMAYVFTIGCMNSLFDEGAYMIATCSGLTSEEDDDEEDYDDEDEDEDDISNGARSFLAMGGAPYGWSIAAGTATAAVLTAVFC